MPDASSAEPGEPLDPDAPLPAGRPLHLRASAVGLVFVGGALGTFARYGLAEALPTHPGKWPAGTFVANVVGAFVLGLLLEALLLLGEDAGWRQRLRLLGGTGFCGGFTTYSTLAVETDLLARADHGGLAALYLIGTALAGLVAVVLGVATATAVLRGVDEGSHA